MDNYDDQKRDFDFFMKVALIEEYRKVIDITADLLGFIIPENQKQFIVWSALNDHKQSAH